jgi:hypothetical protein
MASVKISELQSITNVTTNDVLLVTDVETSTSRKLAFEDLAYSISDDMMGDYATRQNLQFHEGLATGYLYVQNLTIGG